MKNLYRNWLLAMALLDRRDRVKYYILSVCQILLSALDIVAVAVVGFVTVLLLNYSQPANPVLSSIQSFLNLTTNEFSIALMAFAVILFTLRTWLAVKLIKSALLFLGRRSAAYSSKVFNEMLDRPSIALSSTPLVTKQYALITGANSKILGILGGFSGVISDLSVTLGLFVFFLIASPSVALSAAAIGLIFLITLVKQTAGRGSQLSRIIAETEMQSRSVIARGISRYRESFVSGNLGYFKDEFGSSRSIGVEATANWTFLPNVGKYVLEAGVILGGLLLGIALFWFESPESATSLLAMFLAASTRLAPALIRLQQGIVSIKGHTSQKLELDALATEISVSKKITFDAVSVDAPLPSIRSEGVMLEVKGVHYRHEQHVPLIENWTFSISSGAFVALVGKSGSGKSSLADLILGLIEPSSGSVLIDSQNPAMFIRSNRGSVAYVPQYASLSEGTIRSNLLLGHDKKSISEEELLNALRACCIEEIALAQPQGLDSPVSEDGRNLSGGQRQRLSLAHALLGNPRFLILDEATASLDKKNEISVMSGIRRYLPKATILAVTHSQNLISASDEVYEIRNSSIVSIKSN